MTTTTIYFLEKDRCHTVDIRNAWRSAMYVWNDVARRYCGFERFPMGFRDDDNDKMMAVWNFNNRNPGVMAEHEAIALLSTMDNMLLEPSRWEQLVEAFEKYGAEHPDSSFGEQAEAIRRFFNGDVKVEDLTGIGWRQTSVCDSAWLDYNEDDEAQVYDPATGDKHSWLMEQIDEEIAAKNAESVIDG